ncbi:hypothetical protein KC343_g13805 [Hortaea werneckii]|nr:hypothetical protein KC317_g14242 [Hortaea werneckii]KAI7598807.1 hypothetical protein KC346_g14056 [Hortaea werneckii]KAI7605248.1 hypothetical protein KC343_g13805 [Hortaea werneckii]KAI7641222.1 hypothetical protein KC319_g13600 [Hortaea werneckii]KAI7683143.1 hypothetical protein KC322_g13812 [Hortaea werneckii]
MDIPMPDAVPSFPLNRLQQTRQAQLNTALTHRTTAQARLATASAAFCLADEANITASSQLLDFKAGPPQKPATSRSSKGKTRANVDGSRWVDSEGTEGMTGGQIKRFKALKRAQKLAQREFEKVAEEVVQAQEEVAVASIRVRWTRRALEELEE